MRLILVAIAALSVPATSLAQSASTQALSLRRRERRRALQRHRPARARESRPRDSERPRCQGRLRGGRGHRRGARADRARGGRSASRAAWRRRKPRAATTCCSRRTCRSTISRIFATAASSFSSLRSRLPSFISTTCVSGSSRSQEEAGHYKPYTARADAPQVPENLAVDLSRTTKSINLYEQTLSRTRSDQEVLRESFERDILRFRELKGG